MNFSNSWTELFSLIMSIASIFITCKIYKETTIIADKQERDTKNHREKVDKHHKFVEKHLDTFFQSFLVPFIIEKSSNYPVGADSNESIKQYENLIKDEGVEKIKDGTK